MSPRRATEALKRRCIWCDGRGNLGGWEPCEHCDGTGLEIITRDEAWSRDKAILPGGREKFVRYAAEIPPELAKLIDAAHRKHLGTSASQFSRAGAVRAALHLYLETVSPEAEPALDGTAREHVDLPALPSGGLPVEGSE